MSRWLQLTLAVLAGPTLLFSAGAVILLGGLYDVAASNRHWAPVAWLIDVGVDRSVATHSRTVGSVPILADRDREILGARHFELQCAACHGSLSSTPERITRHMLPAPPDLARNVDRWSDRELFWIVQHGLKFTGMPAWTTQDRSDEVWSMVAFLRLLPRLDAMQYAALAGTTTALKDQPAAARCAGCHGDADHAPVSRLIPVIQGREEADLVRALRDYRSGDRPSGYMEPEAARLSDADILRLAAYYAALDRPPPPR